MVLINYNNPARWIIQKSYVMLNVQGPLLDLVFVLTSFSFVFLSIHPSFHPPFMCLTMKHELVSCGCPAHRKRRNKWKKVKKEEVSKIFKENYFLGYGYGMNCIMKAQMVCLCKNRGVCGWCIVCYVC